MRLPGWGNSLAVEQFPGIDETTVIDQNQNQNQNRFSANKNVLIKCYFLVS